MVERTLAWVSRNRRLVRDFDIHARTATALVGLAMIKITLRRLAVWQSHELLGQTLMERTELEKARIEARRFVDSLAERFSELNKLSLQVKRLNHIGDDEYAHFRALFESFSKLSAEFQSLSHLTEGRLIKIGHDNASKERGHNKLNNQFSRLQVPMLCAVINTNMRLLKAWDDRLQTGEPLPFGAFEFFLQTLRIISDARDEMRRPCYGEWLDEEALHEADRVERLLDALIEKAPKLREFL